MSTPPVSPRASSKAAAPSPSSNRRGQSTSGFPFPSSNDSPRRPGSSRAVGSTASIRTRRGSNASSILSLDSKRGGADSIAEAGSNAISALLQPPIIRTGLLPHTHAPSGIRPPSTRDIPPVTLTNIPHVDPSVFNSYISQAGSLYNALRQAREEQAGSSGGGGGGDGTRRHSVGRRNSQLDGDQAPLHGSTTQRRPSALAGVTPGTPGTPSALQALQTPPDEAPSSPSRHRKGSSSSEGGSRKRPGLAVAPLSTIPSIYFEQDFHLENPRTFDVVSEKSEIIRQPANGSASGGGGLAPPTPGGGRKALAANAILQEKLSWYMDTVEIHLISSISTASTSFFDALKELRELHAEAEGSVQQIKVLREDLAKLDENMAVGGLEVVSMKRKRDNLRKLNSAVQQLEAVLDGFTGCEKRMEAGEIGEALDGLSNLEKLIAGDEDGRKATASSGSTKPFQGPLVDLRGLKALETASDDIAYLRKRIGTTLEAKFIATLLGDLRQHVQKVPAADTFKRWDSASSRRRGQHARTPSGLLPTPAFMEIDPKLREDLLSQLKSLAKAETIMQATFTYREAVQKEFKNIIRRHIPSSSDDDAESTTSVATTASRSRSASDRSAVLARNLRALEPEDAEAMFQNIYANIGEALRRLSTQVKVLLDITSSLGGPPPGLKSPPIRSPAMSPRLGFNSPQPANESSDIPLIPQEEMQQVLDLSSLLGQVVDLSQNQITKLLKVRSEQSTHLETPFFLRYFTLNRLFADECENVSGRSGVSLKTVVQDHIKSFVQTAGDAEKQALVRKMDADVWDARDFGAEENSKLKAVIDASVREVEEWSKATLLWSDETNGNADAKLNGLGIGIPSINEPPSSGTEQNGVEGNSDSASAPISRSTTPQAETQKSGKPTVRAATLDDQSFLLPSSALAVLSGIIMYLQLVTCIPALAPDISISLLDYLRLFNSRSQQLILGAGATRSAGLKNITTKHLALSSQALSFVAALVPYIRECVRRYLPTAGSGSGVLADFDKVKRTLQEHQAGIVDKLVEIMNGRAVAHVVSFKKVDWERSDSGSVGTYMETLAKETTMLQKVLMRHLPEETVGGIMMQVMKGYRDVWGKAFDIVEVRSQEAKDRLKRDAEFFKARIGKLESAGDIGEHIINIVDEKKIAGSEKQASSAPISEPKKSTEETKNVEEDKSKAEGEEKKQQQQERQQQQKEEKAK